MKAEKKNDPPYVINLTEQVNYREGQITSRSMMKSLDIELPFSLYAAAAGESISLEETDVTKLLHVLDGRLEVIILEKVYTVAQNELLVIPAHTWHELKAVSNCKFLQIETT